MQREAAWLLEYMSTFGASARREIGDRKTGGYRRAFFNRRLLLSPRVLRAGESGGHLANPVRRIGG
jgi:hypothetical protein